MQSIYQAAADLSDLLSKGYAEKSAMLLVGDHFRLNNRQRKALTRITVAKPRIDHMREAEVKEAEVKDQTIAIDGFNLIIFAEALLSGGYVFEGLDGVFRDIAGIHGSYRRVLETHGAVDLINESIVKLGATKVHWYLDSPVSNSGRLRAYLLSDRFTHVPWEVHVIHNPDKALIDLESGIILSNDRVVQESANRWFNFSAYLVRLFGDINPHIVRKVDQFGTIY
jgi:hypothetical protein